jgi:hypothetical protein
MKGRCFQFWLAWLVLLPATLRGDGGFIPATAFERVQIPDQRALIHFANGTETLVIDTAFKGDGTNFAWIIPVPSVPTLEPATTGLFTTLQFLFQPRIIHEVAPYYWAAVFLGFLIAYVFWKRHRGESAVGMLILVLLLVLLAGILLPSTMHTAGPTAGPGVQVHVIDRKQVGIYETATLSSRDGGALFDWLQQNGFATPTNFVPAIRAYAQQGWCFVASKIRTDTSQPQGARAHPLTLKFKTDRPVYPLRLTGINNDSCHIDLYVFGPERAELPHFKVERCAEPTFPSTNDTHFFRQLEGLRIRHPLLRTLVADSPVATKLAGHLTSLDMLEDAYITWKPFQEARLTHYSRHGAAVFTTNIVIPILVVGLLVLLYRRWFHPKRPADGTRTRKGMVTLFLATLVCWGTIYVCLPKTDVVVTRIPRRFMSNLHDYLVPGLLEQLQWPGKPVMDADLVRQVLVITSDFRKTIPARYRINLFSGAPWMEEDSPGNYMIRAGQDGIDYLWYDMDGAETVVPLFR